jgi:feruloyl esterase
MMPRFLYISVPALFQCAAAVASSTFEQRCLAFQPELVVNNATRNILEYVATGTKLNFPDNDATCNRGTQVVSENICRIALSIKTSNQSSIAFEAWLPEKWTGRFLATGNGGIDGCEYTNTLEN